MPDGLKYTNTRLNSPTRFVENLLHIVVIPNFVIPVRDMEL
jgi:hypothetical protein